MNTNFPPLVSHLAGTLSLVVALADAVPALRRAGDVAAARTTPRITVVTSGASLAPEPVVADPAGTLTLMIALGSRGAQCARAGSAADLWHQIPGAGSAPVAVLAVGQTGTHATTGVGVAHVTGSHARVAHCKAVRRGSLFFFFFFSLSFSYVEILWEMGCSRVVSELGRKCEMLFLVKFVVDL